MSITPIPINSGTGPKVAVDIIGTTNFQVVKLMLTTEGATGNLATILPVTNTGTSAVTVGNVLSASGVTIASIATGTVSIVGIPAVTAANVTIASITTGTVAISGIVTISGTVDGGLAGKQYVQDTTAIAATGTGTLILGIQATTVRALALTATGGINVIQTVATISTLLGTVSVSGGGGGVQYSQGDTSVAATGTGTLAFGIQSGATTARAIAITTTGAQHVNVQNVLSASGITIASITTGTVNVVNVLSASGITVASITTGTMNVINVLSASGVTIASITTGTVNVINVLSASGVTIASMTTGTVNVVNTVAISGTVSAGLVTTTASVAVIGTAHASRFQAFVLATTSAAAGVIVKTSGANTIYITDIILSVPSIMNVQLCSETTAFAQVFLASNGGFAKAYTQPIVCTTAQSLRVVLSSSGTCAVSIVGYTFT